MLHASSLTCSFLIRYINYGNDSVLYNNYNYNNYLSLLLILILSLCPVFPLPFFLSATHGVLCSLPPPALIHIHFTQSLSPFLSPFNSDRRFRRNDSRTPPYIDSRRAKLIRHDRLSALTESDARVLKLIHTSCNSQTPLEESKNSRIRKFNWRIREKLKVAFT